MKLFLIGMPGCGKTTIGRAVADTLGCPFIDLDAEIEAKEAMPLAGLFRQKGEAYFRQQERDLLAFFCTSPASFVMATGGGTPCFFSNMQHINRAGKSLFLNVPIPELFIRLTHGKKSIPPPLLSADKPLVSAERLAEVYQQRLSFYEQAHYILADKAITQDMILTLIEKA